MLNVNEQRGKETITYNVGTPLNLKRPWRRPTVVHIAKETK